MYFINHSIHSLPKQCFLTLTMCPEFSVHQISQLIITMSTHKVCYLNFARLLHRTSSTPNSTVGYLLLVSLCMRIIAKLDIQLSYVWICVDISRVGAIDINGIAFVWDLMTETNLQYSTYHREQHTDCTHFSCQSQT